MLLQQGTENGKRRSRNKEQLTVDVERGNVNVSPLLSENE